MHCFIYRALWLFGLQSTASSPSVLPTGAHGHCGPKRQKARNCPLWLSRGLPWTFVPPVSSGRRQCSDLSPKCPSTSLAGREHWRFVMSLPLRGPCVHLRRGSPICSEQQSKQKAEAVRSQSAEGRLPVRPRFQTLKMSQEIDWLTSRAGLCRIDLLRQDVPRDENCGMVCFIDVSTMKPKEKDRDKAKKVTSLSDMVSISPSDFDLGLENMEEKDVIVIQDTEKNNAVCFFRQGSSEEASVTNWLNSDLQKYTIGFQQALSSFLPQRPKHPFRSSVMEKISQNTNSSFQGPDANLLMVPELVRGGLSSS